MRVLRRRAAAMSPREKHLVLLSVGAVSLAFYFIPTFLYATLIVVVCFVVCYYHYGEPLLVKLGLNPRPGLTVPAVLRRWLWGRRRSGGPAGGRGHRAEREPEGLPAHRLCHSGVFRREASASESFLFSPRDFLMGSYIGKPEEQLAGSGRLRDGRSLGVNLRERLSRPNHAVLTPNRRLSFTGEPLGAVSRFTITPRRHYPLQQPGASSVGVLPPTQWDGFRKKNVLTPRNSPAAASPVTIKIARLDHSSPRSPLLDHLGYRPGPKAPADPCSRETVLSVLKESRKREVGEDEGSFTAEQKSKRRRSDSGESAHSAFEPILPNGAPSQLVPKPGSLKRGMNPVMEESIVKRSRTSSVSSGSASYTPRGTLGSWRNPIHSSYSSSQGLQKKKASAPSSPLSSPGSSRSQTPERASKKPREEDSQSPSSASSVRSDQTASVKAATSSKLTPAAKVPVTISSESAGSGGKRKRKIPLMSSHQGDHISLPPPPELGYTITVKDLDQEKKAAFSKIQKVLEEPAPEPEKPSSAPVPTTAQLASTLSSTTTLSSLLAAPLPTTSSPAIPVINVDSSPATSVNAPPPPSSSSSSSSSSVSNPLLEALKMKSSDPASSTSAGTTAVMSAVSAVTTLKEPSSSTLKPSPTLDAPQLPPASQSQPSSTGADQPSAFTQVLGQAAKTESGSTAVAGAGLFGLAGHLSTPSVSSAGSTEAAALPQSTSAELASSTNSLPVSGFKPIFVATTSTSSSTAGQENKPAVPTFKPIFGSTTASSSFGQPPSVTASSSAPKTTSTSTSSIFGGLMSSSTAAPSLFTGLTNISATTTTSASATTTRDPAAQPAGKSLFGNWPAPSTTSTSSTSAPAPTTGSTFQFGASSFAIATSAAPAAAPTAAPTTSSNGTFTFGTTANTQAAPPVTTQNVFTFGQGTPGQNPTTFGGFALANTTAAATTTTTPSTTQSTFPFGKSAFEASTAPSAFNSTAAPPKPFTFGSSAPAPASSPFTFGAAAATTTASSFGTPSKPAFGGSSTGFGFGTTTAPSAAPSFGATSQTQSASTATFTFGSPAPQQPPSGPAQPAAGGFTFNAAIPGNQFGTPVANNPVSQIASFNFGAAAADRPAFGTSTPTFGQSTAAAPLPFGSPGTPAQSFNSGVPTPFGSAATPSFSIGAGSKPSGARQRLQARRQHTRKK
ncbi:nuclear envelope pore membrane protein POM 121 [Myripristis murdjan]|uniref:POM121 transmembrane nucleoporin n=1 Tax=Myripristis murdjan TaxID=586833 RepID=A0A667ZN56_9TELE|nr:nuclear envelope pore membrane protein POM 121 [Myripristis murdjan]